MVRPIRLARIAISAEGLRLRYRFRRAVYSAVLGMIALALLCGALVFAHIAAWYWLRGFWPAQIVALIFAGIDIVLSLIVALVAFRSSAGRVELEALAVRERALDDVTDSLSVSALLVRLADQFLWSRSR